MTTNTSTTPAAAKGRESRRKTIFSIMGITLLATCLLIGIVHGAVNDNSPVSEDKILLRPGDLVHFVLCHSETEYLGGVNVEGWIPFPTINYHKDLQACVARYGPSATHSMSLQNDNWSD